MKPNSLRAGSLLFLGVISLAFSIAAQAGLPLAKSKGKAGDTSTEVAARIRRVEDGLSLPVGENGQPLQLSLKKLSSNS